MSVPEWIRSHVEPFMLWRESTRRDPGPAPDPELGRNLESLDDVSRWLSHPTNWFVGDIDIIKWSGSVPTISESHAWQLAPDSWGRAMMLRVVLIEHGRRKRGERQEVQPMDPEEL